MKLLIKTALVIGVAALLAAGTSVIMRLAQPATTYRAVATLFDDHWELGIDRDDGEARRLAKIVLPRVGKCRALPGSNVPITTNDYYGPEFDGLFTRGNDPTMRKGSLVVILDGHTVGVAESKIKVDGKEFPTGDKALLVDLR